MFTLWPLVYSHVALVVTQSTLLSIAAQHTRRGSPFRYCILVLCLALCVTFVKRLASGPIDHGWLGLCVATAPLANFVTAVDKLVFRGWDFESYSRLASDALVKQGKDPKTLDLDRQKMASQILEQPRGVGTFWQVANVPPFDSRKGVSFVPERSDYVWQRSIRLPLFYAARMALCQLHLYLVSSAARATDTSLEHAGWQIATTWCTWLADLLLLEGIMDLLGLVTALTNPSRLWQHRPLFGDFHESYTIRRFWGVTWHQNLRSWLEGWSNFITRDILHLPRTGMVQRYVRLLLSFALSGVLHMFGNMGIGIPFPHWPTFWFFVVQGVGIMAEDAIIALSKRLPHSVHARLGRIVGYVWVICFMGLTKPWWQAAVSEHSSPRDSMLNWNTMRSLFWNDNYQ